MNSQLCKLLELLLEIIEHLVVNKLDIGIQYDY